MRKDGWLVENWWWSRKQFINKYILKRNGRRLFRFFLWFMFLFWLLV